MLKASEDLAFRSVILASFTDAELDHARMLESAMLPADRWTGRTDVRQALPRRFPCSECATLPRPCERHRRRVAPWVGP